MNSAAVSTAGTTRISIEEEILALKKQHGALILAHFYEEGEIQDIADHVGDSLFLAQMGQKSQAPVILLAGVVFMAESVKILSPEKTVLVPDLNAGCSLVDHSPYDKYLKWRREHPEHLAITYINSSAAVKSISDVICTSSNAEKIIRSIPADRPVLFGPDQNLGRYLAKKLQRPMDQWPGSCEVHILFSARKLFNLKSLHPKALVLAHPECNEAVLQYADVIGATSRLLDEVKTNTQVNEFIVATEPGIMHQMRKARPGVVLYEAPAEGSCACNECPYMKLSTLEKIRNALRTLSPKVEVEEGLRKRAQISLDRMMAITNGQSVQWPDRFEG
jgi:quinolinate synthase